MAIEKWWLNAVKPLDHNAREAAHVHQQRLTKPAGSLGRLESIAENFAAWQGLTLPVLDNIAVVVFAADHGVCQQQVSAFPQAVTTQMISNFLTGGAAISVLSRSLAADFSVVNMGVVEPLPESLHQHVQLIDVNIAPSTQDFSRQSAMTDEQLQQCLATGKARVMNIRDCHLFIGGEMGIGNTTSAAAMYAALLSQTSATVVGPGTGIDTACMQRKQIIVDQALALHNTGLENPLQVLRSMGGFEIAALVGSYIACAQEGIPVLVDGFICTAAALIAVRLNAGVRDWLLFSHCSAEPAHRLALQTLEAEPLLDLGLRLGEGSGAAVATPLLQSALQLHRDMATFTQAGVSENHR